MRMLIGMGLTAGGMLVASDPDTVNVLEQELLKTLPSLKGVKDQMESFIGGPVGAETIIAALFIVFCGRQVMTILDKAFDMWREERRANKLHQRELAAADAQYARESGGAAVAVAVSVADGPGSGGLRAIRAASPHPS